jgi:hypothetical protein
MMCCSYIREAVVWQQLQQQQLLKQQQQLLKQQQQLLKQQQLLQQIQH